MKNQIPGSYRVVKQTKNRILLHCSMQGESYLLVKNSFGLVMKVYKGRKFSEKVYFGKDFLLMINVVLKVLGG